MSRACTEIPVVPRRRRLPWLACIALGCGAFVLGGCATFERIDGPMAGHEAPAVSDAEHRSFERALAAMDDARWHDAHERLQALVADRPDLPGLRVNLAIALRHLDDTGAARELLEYTVERFEAFAPAHHQLGLLLREAGEFAAADVAYARAIALDPAYAAAHYNRAVLNDLYLWRPAVALAHFQHYQALQDSADPTVDRWIAEIERRVDRDAAIRDAPGGTTRTERGGGA